MSYSAAVLAAGPKAYYRLDESSGVTAFDISGDGYNATVSGATLSQVGALVGDSDNAMLFTGTGAVAAPSSINYTSWTAISLLFWIKLTGTWHMITATCDNSATILLYLDGVVFVSGSGDRVVIDNLFDLAGSGNGGDLDEIAFFNRVLTPAEISLFYFVGTTSVAFFPTPSRRVGNFPTPSRRQS